MALRELEMTLLFEVVVGEILEEGLMLLALLGFKGWLAPRSSLAF